MILAQIAVKILVVLCLWGKLKTTRLKRIAGNSS
jgi:hypothetical protein